MPEIAREIMADLEKLLGMVDAQNGKEALRLILEPMQGLLEAEEKSSRQLHAYYKVHRESNRKIVQHMVQRNAALSETISEIKERLAKAKEELPKPNLTSVFKQFKKKTKPAGIAPKLLSAEELKQQIIKKAETPPPPPRTSGNIWEGWQAPKNISDDELEEMDS